MIAMEDIQSKSCVKFREYNPSKDAYHVAIVDKPGCSSHVGLELNAQPGQKLHLGRYSGCVDHGTIIHELMHALGFYHEQSRSDRDDYVKIHWDNMEKEGHFNFRIGNPINDYGTPYDYCSIMHYGQRDVSRNGKSTITPIRNTECELGEARQMSVLDIERINLVYKCSEDNKSEEDDNSEEESSPVEDFSNEETVEVFQDCEDRYASWCSDNINFYLDLKIDLCQKLTGMMSYKCKKSCNFCGI